LKKTKVAIVRCESYEEAKVYDAVKRGLELLGGIDLFIKQDDYVLLKVNNLAGAKPERAITTHPSILNAMIRLTLEKTKNITYGDSPGYETPSVGLKKSGFVDVADRYKVPMGDFDNSREVNYPEGAECKNFRLVNGCLGNENIISLSKMKTHMVTRITGAVKNQFGCVHGFSKAKFHVKMGNPVRFSKMLIDLNKLLKPRLFIMDGIVAMEGNGPMSGTPVKMNCLIMSTDPVAVDTTFCRMINLPPLFVPTIKYGKLMGLGTYLSEEIEYVGDPLNDFLNLHFDVVRKPIKKSVFKALLPSIIRNSFYAKPVIDSAKCVHCGVCVTACPVKGKAINFVDKTKKSPPVYNYRKCIRCYCCQEMCPHQAIYVKR
jgi:uncharacterized protein (DUF362 family)/NAD-dependent dihydropyrimidine dehydrogenase PreA subunit